MAATAFAQGGRSKPSEHPIDADGHDAGGITATIGSAAVLRFIMTGESVSIPSRQIVVTRCPSPGAA